MASTKFEKSNIVNWHDKVLAKTVLRLFPRWIYPNYITIFRFLATPPLILLFLYNQYQVGLIAFLLVAFTDAIDGSLARTRHQITEWGRIYDPIADKLLISGMVFAIVYKHIDSLTAFFVVGIELAIVFVAWIRFNKGYKVQANIWGKIKMILQVFAVSVLILSLHYNLANLLPLGSGVLYLAMVFAIVSLLSYGI